MVDFKALLAKQQKPPEDVWRMEVYTDGACQPNPGPGGWALRVVECDTQSVFLENSGPQIKTTNNRMELQAVIEALRWAHGAMPEGSTLTIFSDSELCIKGMSSWIFNWQQLGWRRSAGELVNSDLWQEAYNILMTLHLQRAIFPAFRWIRGHAGHEHNEAVDQLAVAAAQQAQTMDQAGPLVSIQGAFRNLVMTCQGLGDTRVNELLGALEGRLEELEGFFRG